MNKIIIDENICKACSLCIEVCPKKILQLSTKINDKGYNPIECINENECISCTFCALTCPDMAITINDGKGE